LRKAGDEVGGIVHHHDHAHLLVAGEILEPQAGVELVDEGRLRIANAALLVLTIDLGISNRHRVAQKRVQRRADGLVGIGIHAAQDEDVEGCAGQKDEAQRRQQNDQLKAVPPAFHGAGAPMIGGAVRNSFGQTICLRPACHWTRKPNRLTWMPVRSTA